MNEVMILIKKTLIGTLILSVCLLTSCSLSGTRTEMLNNGNEEKKLDARIEQILSLLKNKDGKAIEALFSKQALSETKDFDSEINYLLNFFQGDVISWERNKWTSEELNDNSQDYIMLVSWYTVITDKDKYIFFIIDYTKDGFNQDNEGVCSLRVIKSADKKTQFTKYWQDMKIPGIYKPKQ